MRILHAPQNIGGMASTLAAAQRQLGHDALSCTVGENDFRFPSDVVMAPEWWTQPELLLDLARKHDVFHFYFGESLLGASLKDVPILSRLGKRIFFYFCGCDIRDEKWALFHHKYSTCTECFPKLCSANREVAARVAQRYGVVNFVSTPDLLEHVPRGRLLPQVIDLALIDRVLAEPALPSSGDTVRIAHAPSNRAIKGTRHVEAAVAELRREGRDVELVLIERTPHVDAMRITRGCDLAVDQVLAGAYGQFAAEAMALGVPTVSSVRADLVGCYPMPPPIAYASPPTLVSTIRRLLDDTDERTRLGSSGPAYARYVHSPTRLAEITLEAYA